MLLRTCKQVYAISHDDSPRTKPHLNAWLVKNLTALLTRIRLQCNLVITISHTS